MHKQRLELRNPVLSQGPIDLFNYTAGWGEIDAFSLSCGDENLPLRFPRSRATSQKDDVPVGRATRCQIVRVAIQASSYTAVNSSER